jgi:hypothetical protein
MVLQVLHPLLLIFAMQRPLLLHFVGYVILEDSPVAAAGPVTVP